ncbi:MAG: hypothetical protein ACFCVC_10355 [Acidimicrobiia bacterium]
MWWLASILSAGAGSIHIALGLAHAEGPRLHQVFFLGVGTLQVGWSSIAWPDGPGKWLYRGAIAGNVGVLVVYAVSRIVGIPPGDVFEAGRADVIAAGFEVALLVILVRRVDVALPRSVAVVSTVVILVLMVVGVLAGFDGVGHFGPGGHIH